MKVILLQDVAKVGRRFDIVNVPDGHAQNMLIPKGLAKPATPQEVAQVRALKKAADASREDRDRAFHDALAALEEKTITVKVDANELGHMFQALKAGAIVEACKDAGITIDEQYIVFPEPIKSVGKHEVVLAAGKEQYPFSVEIVAK